MSWYCLRDCSEHDWFYNCPCGQRKFPASTQTTELNPFCHIGFEPIEHSFTWKSQSSHHRILASTKFWTRDQRLTFLSVTLYQKSDCPRSKTGERSPSRGHSTTPFWQVGKHIEGVLLFAVLPIVLSPWWQERCFVASNLF